MGVTLSSCARFSKPKQIEIKTVEVERVIPKQNRPRPVQMNDVHFYVVNEDTVETI